MATGDVTAEFYISLPDGPVEEAGVMDAFAAQPDAFIASYLQEGGLRLAQGGEAVEMDDALLWLIPALCFDSVVVLGRSDLYSQPSWTSGDTFGMERRDGRIVVTGEDFDPMDFPDGPLQKALLDAGQRFMQAMEKIWPDAASADRNRLQDRSAAAAAALAG